MRAGAGAATGRGAIYDRRRGLLRALRFRETIMRRVVDCEIDAHVGIPAQELRQRLARHLLRHGRFPEPPSSGARVSGRGP